MGYYKSRDEFLSALPHKESLLADVDKAPLNVGDNVLILDDGGRDRKGIITKFDSCPCAKVQVEGEIGEGSFVACSRLRLLSGVVSSDENVIIEALVASAREAVNIAAINGKIYTLTSTPLDSANELVRQLATGFALKARAIRQDATLKIAEATQKLNNLTPMPLVTQADVERGHLLYLVGRDVVHVLPFHYAPRYVLTTAQTYELSGEHQKMLTKELRTHIHVRQDYVSGVKLTTSDFKPYEHYHGTGAECLGTLEKFRSVSSVPDIIAFRDRHQRMLEAINYNSLARSQPHECPNVSALMDCGKKVSKINSWSIEPLRLGDLVKITRAFESFPPELLGVIGKVVHNRGGNAPYGVGLLFTFTRGRECNCTTPSGTGYYFPRECLEHAPEGSARTRKSPIDQSTERTPTLEATTIVVETTATTPPERGWTTAGG